MFAKSITRDVKGVIKVGQGEDANVRQELEEYVVTRELQKHIARFFEAYKRGITGNTDNMGVWISGFFGSGKSHFLKILSYLLENREVDGKRAIDYFVEDHKIDNGMVLADMKLAADTSADVILFNIDSKSEMAGKQNKDSVHVHGGFRFCAGRSDGRVPADSVQQCGRRCVQSIGCGLNLNCFCGR